MCDYLHEGSSFHFWPWSFLRSVIRAGHIFIFQLLPLVLLHFFLLFLSHCCWESRGLNISDTIERVMRMDRTAAAGDSISAPSQEEGMNRPLWGPCWELSTAKHNERNPGENTDLMDKDSQI